MEILWCQFFVTAYEKGVYDFMKDFVMPALILFLTIYSSIRLSKKQVDDRIKEDENKRVKENESILRVLESSNERLINELDSQLKSLKIEKNKFSFESFDGITLFKVYTGQFESIMNFGFHKLYIVFDENTKMTNSDFLDYWDVISNAPNRLNNIENYMLYINETYNSLNNVFNNNTHNITVQCSNYVHRVFEPFTSISIDMEELSNNPMIKLAHDVRLILDEYKKSKEPRFLQIKTLLESLDQLKSDPVSSKALDSEFAQLVLDTLGLIKSFENLFIAADTSIDKYITVLSKNNDILKKIRFE